MLTSMPLYEKLNSVDDVREVFAHLHTDVQQAHSRASLAELYKRADYLVALFHSPCWKMKCGDDAQEYDVLSREEFEKVARGINDRARELGIESHFEETWDRS